MSSIKLIGDYWHRRSELESIKRILVNDYYDDCENGIDLNLSGTDNVPISIFYLKDQRTTTDLNKEDANFMWKTLMIDCLMRMQHKSHREKHDLVGMLIRNNQKNSHNLKMIQEFNATYNKHEAVRWYKKESCIYKTLNNALRKSCINTIFTYRFYIRDLANQLREEQHNLVSSHNGNIIYLYRGQRSPKSEVDKLKESQIGSFIAVDSFFSTSKSKSIAIGFTESKNENDYDFLPVFFEVKCDLRLNTKPYADISSERLGESSHEEEVLFMIGTLFILQEVVYDNKEKMWKIKLTLADENQHHLTELYKSIQNEMSEKTDLLTLGALLKTCGDYEHALRFYTHSFLDLMENENNLTKKDYHQLIHILSGIAAVEAELGRYETSIDIFDLVIREFQEHDRSEHRDFDLAMALYSKSTPLSEKGDYYDALKHCHRALKLSKNYPNCDASFIAACYNTIGDIHGNMSRLRAIKGDFRGQQTHFHEAFNYYLKGLNLQRRIHKKTPNHYDIGSVYLDIGQLYRDIGRSDEALEYTLKAYRIFQESFPNNHHWIGILLDNIGEIYVQQGRYDEAETCYKQALDTYRKTLPDDHRFIGETFHNMGKLYYSLKQNKKALYYFHLADRIYRRKIPNYHYLATELHQQIKFVRAKL